MFKVQTYDHVRLDPLKTRLSMEIESSFAAKECNNLPPWSTRLTPNRIIRKNSKIMLRKCFFITFQIRVCIAGNWKYVFQHL